MSRKWVRCCTAAVILSGALATSTASAQEPLPPIASQCDDNALATLVCVVVAPLVLTAVFLETLGEGIEAACLVAGGDYLPPPEPDDWQWSCVAG